MLTNIVEWAKIGRAVGEIKQGDVGIGNSGHAIFTKSEIELAYRHGSLIGLYPTESYVSFEDGEFE